MVLDFVIHIHSWINCLNWSVHCPPTLNIVCVFIDTSVQEVSSCLIVRWCDYQDCSVSLLLRPFRCNNAIYHVQIHSLTQRVFDWRQWTHIFEEPDAHRCFTFSLIILQFSFMTIVIRCYRWMNKFIFLL